MIRARSLISQLFMYCLSVGFLKTDICLAGHWVLSTEVALSALKYMNNRLGGKESRWRRRRRGKREEEKENKKGGREKRNGRRGDMEGRKKMEEKVECVLTMFYCVKPEGSYQVLCIRIQLPSGKSCLNVS